MYFEFFTAKKLIQGSESSKQGTGPIIAIAIGGIALGVAVMLISVAILSGFQKEIRQKVVGFGGHIQITSFELFQNLETKPIDRNQTFLDTLQQDPRIDHISVYANKAGIIKTDDEIEGVIYKGVSDDYKWDFFEDKLKAGKTVQYSKDQRSDSVLISQKMADKLKVEVNEKILLYFIQEGKLRPRKFTIAGLYSTGMEGFDDQFVVGDIQHIQRINKWDSSQVGGFEVNIKNYDHLYQLDDMIYDYIGLKLRTATIVEQNADIFAWLRLQDVNVYIIITLIIAVCGVCMTTALLILILDKTTQIGVLKALGANNWSIQKIFLIQAAYLVGKGLFWGNLLGMSLYFIQKYLKLLKLPEETYYLSYVPVDLEWWHWLLLNVGTLITCVLILMIPSRVIANISPVKAIKFD